MVLGRFAPSPSGRMHLGNAFSALLAWLSAKSQGGEIVLRVEDLDPARSRTEYAEAIMADFKWLGLTWDRRAENQSLRGPAYEAALERLHDMGLLFPCTCRRDQLHAASAPHASDGRVIYPGTCRHRTLPCSGPHSLRVRVPDRVIRFTDGLQGPQAMNLAREWGDFIVRRSDGVAAYQLAVVVDAAASGVSEVVRGRDLLTATPAQLWLYEVLGLEAPDFYHVPMLISPEGRRLSKRDRDLDLGALQKTHTPAQVVGLLASACGLIDRYEPVSARDLVPHFDWSRVRKDDIVMAGCP